MFWMKHMVVIYYCIPPYLINDTIEKAAQN